MLLYLKCTIQLILNNQSKYSKLLSETYACEYLDALRTHFSISNAHSMNFLFEIWMEKLMQSKKYHMRSFENVEEVPASALRTLQMHSTMKHNLFIFCECVSIYNLSVNLLKKWKQKKTSSSKQMKRPLQTDRFCPLK